MQCGVPRITVQQRKAWRRCPRLGMPSPFSVLFLLSVRFAVRGPSCAVDFHDLSRGPLHGCSVLGARPHRCEPAAGPTANRHIWQRRWRSLYYAVGHVDPIRLGSLSSFPKSLGRASCLDGTAFVRAVEGSRHRPPHPVPYALG
ncbi:hypothetical protein ACLOJK_016477 [Asimina triloba]